MNASVVDTERQTRTLVQKAAALRPLLRSLQADTEARTYPGQEIYDAIDAAGLFGILTPRRFGGHELSLNAFYQVVIEIARGCPSTGWWFALGTGHSAQVASYFSEAAQAEIFGFRKNFQAPWSFAAVKPVAVREEGGYRVTGTWLYSSGVPYASHFMGNIPLPKEDGASGSPMLTIIVPEGHFTRLDNWGDLLGMKGSGSHGVKVEDIFVPDHMTFSFDGESGIEGPTVGYDVHANPLYGGLFLGFAEGGLSAMATGLAYAAIDEYEELIVSRNTPGTDVLRARNPDFQRSMGMALAWADSARAITLHGGDLYLSHSRDNVLGASPFTVEKALRMDGIYHTAERLAYDVVTLMVRTASSGALKEDSRLSRYMRDIIMCVSRGHDQFEFRAANIARQVMTRHRGLSF